MSYGYVGMNPMRYNDPSGLFFGAIGNFFSGIGQGIGNFAMNMANNIQRNVFNPIVRVAQYIVRPIQNSVVHAARAIQRNVIAPIKRDIGQIAKYTAITAADVGLGVLTGGLAAAAFGAPALLAGGGIVGGLNALLATNRGIYSSDRVGAAAMILDSTWSLPMTAAGLGYQAYLTTIGGTKLNDALSQGSNAFAYTGASNIPTGLAIGNVYGINSSADSLPDAVRKETYRHEVAHTWQYRAGGVLAFAKLAQEQVTAAASFGFYRPYAMRGNLEHAADKEAARPANNAPFYLQSCPQYY